MEYALSLKQPWAALLALGRKTIEVRRWPTAHRGRVLIHAARVSDERPVGWDLVPPEARDLARLTGGFVGAGTLTDCRAYPSREAFAADGVYHLNDPSWFVPPELYGFVFTDLAVLPFRRYPGWVRIFEVTDPPPRRRPRAGGRPPAPDLFRRDPP